MGEEQKPAEAHAPVAASEPKGIGGWLILPLIGFVGTVMLTMNNLSAISGSDLNTILTSDIPAIVALRLPTMVSLTGGLTVVAIALACIILLAKQSRRLPGMAITFYVALLIASVLEYLADIRISAVLGEARDPSVVKDVARSTIAAAIWIPYFLKSKRVRNTFTR